MRDSAEMTYPDYCPCEDEQPDPCPACGATVKGDDPVRGVCQARHNSRRPEPLLEWGLKDKKTGEIVARQTILYK
jgi:hypothetical protein